MKMRPILYILIFTGLLASCAKPKAPEFKGVDNIQIQLSGFTKARISGEAQFFNPNKANVYIHSADMKVFLEDQQISQFDKDIDVLAGGNTDFSVPVEFDVALKDIDLSSFTSALGIGEKKERKFFFKGHIRVKMHGVNFKIPVEHIERIEI